MIQESFPQNSRCSLYVNGLDKSVTEGMLFETFKNAGIVNLRICREITTRQSLGYGYLNFISNEKAAQALETMNFVKIKNRPIQLTWIHRDPAIRHSGIGNIFVKKLPANIDIEAFHKHFKRYGNIWSSKISCDNEGKSKGYGFVQYDNVTSANRAIQDGMEINGVKLEIKPYISQIKNRKARNDGAENFTNIYIKNLNENFNDANLRALFKGCGEIVSYKVIIENEKSKGFGFVSFNTTEAAKLAIEKWNGKEFDGKTLYVGPAQTKAERAKQLKREHEENKKKLQESHPGFNVFVKNLPDNLDDEDLENLFKEYGTISSAKVKFDKEGKSRCFGFVWFNSIDEATKAIKEMNGKSIEEKTLYVSMAQWKKDRQDLLKEDNKCSQHSNRNSSSGSYILPATFRPQRLANPQQFPRFQQKTRWQLQSQIRPDFVHGVGGATNNMPMMAYADSLPQLQNPDNKYFDYM